MGFSEVLNWASEMEKKNSKRKNKHNDNDNDAGSEYTLETLDKNYSRNLKSPILETIADEDTFSINSGETQLTTASNSTTGSGGTLDRFINKQINKMLAKDGDDESNLVDTALRRSNSIDTVVTTGFFREKFAANTERAISGLSDISINEVAVKFIDFLKEFCHLINKTNWLNTRMDNHQIHLPSFLIGVSFTIVANLMRPIVVYYVTWILFFTYNLLKHLAFWCSVIGIIYVGFKALQILHSLNDQNNSSGSSSAKKREQTFARKPLKLQANSMSPKNSSPRKLPPPLPSDNSPKKSSRPIPKPMFTAVLRDSSKSPKKNLDVTEKELKLLQQLVSTSKIPSEPQQPQTQQHHHKHQIPHHYSNPSPMNYPQSHPRPPRPVPQSHFQGSQRNSYEPSRNNANSFENRKSMFERPVKTPVDQIIPPVSQYYDQNNYHHQRSPQKPTPSTKDSLRSPPTENHTEKDPQKLLSPFANPNSHTSKRNSIKRPPPSIISSSIPSSSSTNDFSLDMKSFNEDDDSIINCADSRKSKNSAISSSSKYSGSNNSLEDVASISSNGSGFSKFSGFSNLSSKSSDSLNSRQTTILGSKVGYSKFVRNASNLEIDQRSLNNGRDIKTRIVYD